MALLTKQVKYRAGHEQAGHTRYEYTYLNFPDWNSVDLGEVVTHVQEQYPGEDAEACALRIVNEGLRAFAAERQDPERKTGGLGRSGRGLGLSTFVARMNDPEVPEDVKVALRDAYPQHVATLAAMFPVAAQKAKPAPEAAPAKSKGGKRK